MSIVPGHYRGRRLDHMQGTPTGFGATSLPVVLPAPIEYITTTGREKAARAASVDERPRNALLASAQRLTRDKNADTGAVTGPGLGGASPSGVSVAGWQEEAWSMYDEVGEQRYLATTLANQLGKARLYVGRRTESGEGLDEADIPDEVLRVFDEFGGSAEARSQLVTRLGVNLFIAGDGWLVGIPERLLIDPLDVPDGEPVIVEPPAGLRPINRTSNPDLSEDDALRVAASSDDGDRLTWRMLSVSEVTAVDDQTAELRLSENGGRVLTAPLDELYLIRVWRPHPRRAWEADSPTRASLPVLRELVGLTMHISAQVDSRLAGAGILVVPQSASQALSRASGLPDDTSEDMVTEALILAMQTAIKERDSASALVPLVLTVPDEAAGKIEHLTFATPLDSEARNLRDEAIRRLALSQDAPPEVLLGTGDMNHWGAWLVQEETVSTHLAPPLALICDALTSEYLRPVLDEMGVPDADSYAVGFDVDALISSPTRGADAQSAYQLGVISDKALRDALGFEETDSPFGDGTETAELSPARVKAFEMVTNDPSLIATPGIGAIVSQLETLLGNKPLDPSPLGGAAPTDSAPAASTPSDEGEDSTPSGGMDSPGMPQTVGEPDLGPGTPNAHSSRSIDWEKMAREDEENPSPREVSIRVGRTRNTP